MNTRRSFLGSMAASVAAMFGWQPKADPDTDQTSRFYRQGVVIVPDGRPLILPPGCKAEVSRVRFSDGLSLVRVEHPDLSPTPEAGTIPMVRYDPIAFGGSGKWEIVKDKA